jgi:hypothetical protein
MSFPKQYGVHSLAYHPIETNNYVYVYILIPCSELLEIIQPRSALFLMALANLNQFDTLY